MDAAPLAMLALLAAAAALVVAGLALTSARAAGARATRLRADLDEALAGLASAQTAIGALTGRAEDLERRAAAAQASAQAAAERADAHERRLSQAESRLGELAATPPLPPLPTGRRAPALDDLRATLRAQAAETATDTDDAADGD